MFALERERERERALYWLHWVLLHSCDKYHVFTCLLSVRCTTGLDSEGALYSCPHSALLQLWCNLESCNFFFLFTLKKLQRKNAGTKLHHSRTLMQWTVLYGCPGRIGCNDKVCYALYYLVIQDGFTVFSYSQAYCIQSSPHCSLFWSRIVLGIIKKNRYRYLEFDTVPERYFFLYQFFLNQF